MKLSFRQEQGMLLRIGSLQSVLLQLVRVSRYYSLSVSWRLQRRDLSEPTLHGRSHAQQVRQFPCLRLPSQVSPLNEHSE